MRRNYRYIDAAENLLDNFIESMIVGGIDCWICRCRRIGGRPEAVRSRFCVPAHCYYAMKKTVAAGLPCGQFSYREYNCLLMMTVSATV